MTIDILPLYQLRADSRKIWRLYLLFLILIHISLQLLLNAFVDPGVPFRHRAVKFFGLLRIHIEINTIAVILRLLHCFSSGLDHALNFQ